MIKMKFIELIIISSLVILISTICIAQNNNSPVDYLNVPGPISFNSTSYNLSWTSHPSATYYKQEYLVKGDTADRFKTMLLLEVLTGKANLKNIADSKVAELKKMKITNPVVTYELTANSTTGEYFLDFVVSDNAPNGKVNIAERNIYRYTTFTDKAGEKGVLLLGVSIRSYGNDTGKFLASLKLNKNDLLTKVKQFSMPGITIRK
jgi:hypothetical protein